MDAVSIGAGPPPVCRLRLYPGEENLITGDGHRDRPRAGGIGAEIRKDPGAAAHNVGPRHARRAPARVEVTPGCAAQRSPCESERRAARGAEVRPVTLFHDSVRIDVVATDVCHSRRAAPRPRHRATLWARLDDAVATRWPALRLETCRRAKTRRNRRLVSQRNARGAVLRSPPVHTRKGPSARGVWGRRKWARRSGRRGMGRSGAAARDRLDGANDQCELREMGLHHTRRRARCMPRR